LRTGVLKVALVDVVLLIFAYLVTQDLAWRNSFDDFRGYAASTSYSFLTRRLMLSTGSTVLTSPPTLDWVQVAIAILIILNIAYFLGTFKSPPPPAAART
jgi:hypothetical protein